MVAEGGVSWGVSPLARPSVAAVTLALSMRKFLRSYEMASRRNLKENEIERILLHSEDGEDLFLGEASEEEQDEVIQDFRDDVILSESPDALEVESPQDSDEEIDEVSSQLSSNTSPVTVLSVPDILRGRGRQKQKSSEKFVWHGSHPRSSRTPQRNIIFHPSGNKGIAKSVATGLDSWQLFFTNEVLEKIESHTNQEISEQRKKYKSDRPTISDDDDLVPSSTRPSFVRDTSITELKALFGLYYLAGVLKINHLTVKEIFDKNTGISYFRSTMSEKRFEFLTNCLRFDDRLTRGERRLANKLAPIKELFDHIVETSKNLYSPSDCTTIDEQLLGFRGRCPFRMYIPSKPDKYGIKLLMFCDAKSYYMINSIVYTGKDSTPRGIPVAEYYALELSTTIHNTNRNITYDNWFTSIPTAQKLLSKNVTTVGTLKKNKTELPTHFTETKHRDLNTSMFAYHDKLTLLSYVPPKLSKGKKKNVIMLSTMHFKPDEDKAVNLPEIISFYNQTKGGVDTFDQLCHTYSVSRKTRRWSLCVFYGILNIVGINSMILLHSSDATNKQVFKNRRTYLKTLAFDLIKPHLEERFQYRTLPTSLQISIGDILGKKRPTPSVASPNLKSGRCLFCPRSKDRKSRTQCATCKTFICTDHQNKICQNCL
ncbi:PiggyBac transposable element-derived protein 4 [Eumeta japonica]|uniref:PiggyBac transposable element-derived protein 4 n=1 Tax=Eumeta variegata TaxID=151549 RepID=A0A4C1YB74_EUMVA|nr:PiggyBac transposable element-derived protein 4 [Eumeta japonica]